MGSRLSCACGSGNSGGGGTLLEVNCATGATTSIPLIDINSNTKVEIEYGFAIDGSVDQMQAGRITVLYDQIAAEITSHEIEESTNLGQINSVTITAYQSGSDVGVQVNNTSGEDFIFKYIIVNKFPLFYTP